MKIFICVLLLAAAAVAEPPRYRFARYRFDKRELEEPSPERKESANAEEAPYPAAGYKPSKVFRLPSRQEAAPPSTSYGIPDDSYGAPLRTRSRPEVEYGVPRMAKREEAEGEGEGEAREGGEEKEGRQGEKGEKKEGEGEENGEGETEELRGGEGGEKKKKEGEKSGKLEEAPEDDDEIVSTQGAYYVLLPGSQLQRVQFRTDNDVSKMAYTARLQYKDEDRAPLYVYSAVPQYTVPVAEYAYDVPLASSSAYFQLY